MNKKIIFFLFALFSAGTALAQDTTATKKSAATEITGERRRNPSTKANPHPGGVVTGERTRNPYASKERGQQKPAQPAPTEERSGKPQD